MTAIANATANIDDLVGGGFLACPSLTAFIAGATTAQKTALAAQITAIIDANPGDGQFTTLEVSGLSTLGPVIAEELEVDTGTKTAAATAGAATLNKSSGVVTSEALVTAAGASYVLTLTNNKIAVGDLVFASVQYGTSTTGTPCVTKVDTSTISTAVVTIQNVHASAALNGTIKVSYFVIKAGTPA